MYTVIAIIIIIILIVLFLIHKHGNNFFDLLHFYIEGKDLGFSFKDLRLLRAAALYAGIEEKRSLFWSVSVLNKCIKLITEQTERLNFSDDKSERQDFLTKLYKYRTKLEFENMQNKYHLESTYQMNLKQICVFLVRGGGVFYARLEDITKKYLRFVMFDSSAKRAGKFNWENKPATVYFWKTHDAGYFYYCSVLEGKYIGEFFEIYTTHSRKLTRTQKRKSIRASCKIDALITLLYPESSFDNFLEKSGSIKCTIKNISEDGAMFYVKGKAAKNIKLKLQFAINGKQVVMCGSVRRFLYDEKVNTSRVHFHCSYISQDSRNTVLSYVYNIGEAESATLSDLIFSETEERFYSENSGENAEHEKSQNVSPILTEEDSATASDIENTVANTIENNIENNNLNKETI